MGSGSPSGASTQDAGPSPAAHPRWHRHICVPPSPPLLPSVPCHSPALTPAAWPGDSRGSLFNSWSLC